MSFERFSNVTEHWRVFAHIFCFLTFVTVWRGFNIFRYWLQKNLHFYVAIEESLFLNQERSEYKSLEGSLQWHNLKQTKSMRVFLLTYWMLDSGPWKENCLMSLGQMRAWLYWINSSGIQCYYTRQNSLTWPETSSLRLSLKNNNVRSVTLRSRAV